MHSNPSTTVHHSTLHQGKVAHCLFLTDQICQFSNAFCRWSTTMLRTMQMIRLFVISVYQRREKAINLALLCVEKKRPWRGRSKATCHQTDPRVRRMMICQLGSDISQLQGVTSERGCHAKLYFLKGGKYSRVNSTTNLFLVIWYQGVLPHQIMATHFLKPENNYLTQKTSLKLINSKCLEDGLVFTFQGFPFQTHVWSILWRLWVTQGSLQISVLKELFL